MWMLVRTDDQGNSFLMRDKLDGEKATALHAEYTRKGHKQSYSLYHYTLATKQSVLRDNAILGEGPD